MVRREINPDGMILDETEDQIYEALEERGVKYAIRLLANDNYCAILKNC